MIDSSDVIEINTSASQLVKKIRIEDSPHALVINTHRFGPHSKGDDTRPDQYIQDIKKMRDPIKIQSERIKTAKRLEIEKEVAVEIEQAYNAAVADPISIIG